MKLESKNALLRIVINRAPDAHRWILQGRLAGQMVDELTTTWNATRSERNGHRCVIDLVDVTGVDERGEDALLEMMRQGAELVVRGLYTTSLLEGLKERCKQETEEAG